MNGKILVDRMKENGKGKKYDCIIGVSGGTDSSYLMHIAKEELWFTTSGCQPLIMGGVLK